MFEYIRLYGCKSQPIRDDYDDSRLNINRSAGAKEFKKKKKRRKASKWSRKVNRRHGK